MRKTWLLLIVLAIAAAALALYKVRVVESHDEHGMTPLMRAAAAGDVAAMRRWMGRGANVDARVPSNDFAAFVAFLRWMQQVPDRQVHWTPLMFAARSGCVECVRVLLDAGANVHVRDRDAFSPVSVAAMHGHRPVLELLVARGASVDDPRLLFQGIASDLGLLRFFLAHGTDPNRAVPPGPHQKPIAPLTVAVRHRNAGAVKILLEAGASAEVRDPLNGWPLLRIARREGMTEIEAMLRGAGAKDDGAVEENLLAAVQAGDAAAARAALQAGANANGTNPYGEPLLIAAVEKGNVEVVRALLDHGANVNARTGYDSSALWLARTRRHEEVAALLLARGATERRR